LILPKNETPSNDKIYKTLPPDNPALKRRPSCSRSFIIILCFDDKGVRFGFLARLSSHILPDRRIISTLAQYLMAALRTFESRTIKIMWACVQEGWPSDVSHARQGNTSACLIKPRSTLDLCWNINGLQRSSYF
jgi:hypothetical protein